MAQDIITADTTVSGLSTPHFIFRNTDGQVWNGSAFVAYLTANRGTYATVATEQGTASMTYQATVPGAIPAGVYTATLYAGDSSTETIGYAKVTFEWDGSKILPLNNAPVLLANSPNHGGASAKIQAQQLWLTGASGTNSLLLTNAFTAPFAITGSGANSAVEISSGTPASVPAISMQGDFNISPGMLKGVEVNSLLQAALALFANTDTGETAPVAGSVAALPWGAATREVTSAENITSTGGTIAVLGGGVVSANVTYVAGVPQVPVGGRLSVHVAEMANDSVSAGAFSQAAADKAWATTTRTVTSAANITSDGIAIDTLLGAVQTVGTVVNDVNISAAAVDLIWDEPQAGHTTVGTFGYFLDARVSQAGGGGLTEQQVRDAMKLAPTAGAPAAGSVDLHLDDIQAKTDGLNYTGAFVQCDVQSWDGEAAAVKRGTTSNLPQVDAAAIGDNPTASQSLADFATEGYDSTSNQVNGVKLVDATTTNTDMRGTDAALLAASAPANFGDLAITATTGYVTAGTVNDKTGYSISGTKTTLDDLQDISAADVKTQADQALVDVHLDHLLAVVTTTFPGNAGSIFGEMLERVGTWRYVAAALATAPVTDTAGLALEATSQAIKAKTDPMTYTVANQLDANMVKASVPVNLIADQSGVTIGTVGTVTNPVTAGTVNDKTGYALSAAGIAGIWSEPQAGYITPGTFGYLVDARISLAALEATLQAVKAKTDPLTYSVANRVDSTPSGGDVGTVTGPVDLKPDQSGATVGTTNDLGAAAQTAVKQQLVDALTVDTLIVGGVTFAESHRRIGGSATGNVTDARSPSEKFHDYSGVKVFEIAGDANGNRVVTYF